MYLVKINSEKQGVKFTYMDDKDKERYDMLCSHIDPLITGVRDLALTLMSITDIDTDEVVKYFTPHMSIEIPIGGKAEEVSSLKELNRLIKIKKIEKSTYDEIKDFGILTKYQILITDALGIDIDTLDYIVKYTEMNKHLERFQTHEARLKDLLNNKELM